ncbi:MAG: hypothetical protein ABR587_09895, partial [Candidatus Binatia bacterium]
MDDWPALAGVSAALGACAVAVAWAWRCPRQVIDHAALVLGAAAVLSLLAIAAIVRPDGAGLQLRLD